MKNVWNVKIDEQMYNIALKGRKLIVNGEKIKLNGKVRKKTGLLHEEYEIPIGNKNALFVINTMKAPQLVIDNLDCATGQEYVPVKLPKWAYLFVVLHFVNFVNGALGALITILGLTMTYSVASNKKMNVAVRVLLCLGILVLAYAAVFGIAFALSGALY